MAAVALDEDKLLVALLDIQVGEPADVAELLNRAVRLNELLHMLEAGPQAVVLNEREDFLVGDGVLGADDDEALAFLFQQADVLAEEAEGRVGHHYVGLIQQLQALGAAEVAVAF